MKAYKGPKLLDPTDNYILEILQDDGKATISEISEKLVKDFKVKKLSNTAIRSRINKFEDSIGKDPLIKKYMAVLDCHQLGYKEMLIASLRIKTSKTMDKIREEIMDLEKINAAYLTSGEFPLIIMAKCLNHDDSLHLVEKLRNFEWVQEVKTQIVMDCIKEDPSVFIPKQ
ncbi:MAG: Lrp/AsnC family transcriptional regulator [Promethearchaeota archaeon]